MKVEIGYDILVRFYRQECTQEEKQSVMRWVNASSENAELFFKWEELYFLGKMPVAEIQERLEKAEKRLFQQIQTEEHQQRFFIFAHRWMRYAAVIVVILAFSGFLTWFWQAGRTEWIVAATGPGENKALVLPDSSKVWLNENTTLRYPRSFDFDERVLSLLGEAYFEVTPNKHRPFIVRGTTMDVQVLGTKFNFCNTSDSRLAEVSLIEGEVKVVGHEEEGMITLSPGQKVMLNAETRQMKVAETDAVLDAVWHDDLIPFKNASILKIANVLEHLYRVKVVLLPDVNRTATYSGVIKRKDSVEEVLQTLENTLHLQYKKQNGKIFITSNKK